MKKLPLTYQGGYSQTMKQVWRDSQVAIYKDVCDDWNQDGSDYHEVFEIKIAKACTKTFGDKIVHLPDRETVPGNERFGGVVRAAAVNSARQAFICRDRIKAKIRGDASAIETIKEYV